MLKREIVAEDFDGNKYVEIAYFHYSKSEILEQEISVKGGLRNHLVNLMREGDNFKIYSFFKRFLLGAYGKKSEDGRRFVKNAEQTEAFAQSKAFEDLLFDLLENQSSMETFFNEIMPSGISAELNESQKKMLDSGLLTEDVRKELMGE